MTTWLRGWRRRRRHERDLERELRLHLDHRIDELIAGGRSREEAARQARIELGGVEQIAARARDERPGATLDQLVYDLRDAWRALRRSPGVTATAVALIAMVIGGNTTIFSMVHGMLTKPAPGVRAERLVTLASIIDGRLFGPEDSYQNYLEFVTQAKTLESLCAYQFERFTVTTADASYAVLGALTSQNYFDTLGLHLARGRTFTREESQRDASGLVVVISHRLWQNQLQGTEEVIGKVIVVNGHAATVIGVAPARFNGATLAESADVWLPLSNYAHVHGTEAGIMRNGGNIMVGRLAPGVSLSEARAEFGLISTRLQATNPTANRNRLTTVFAYSMLGTGSGAYQQSPIFIGIFGSVMLLTVMIVCANVANLMLARAVVRQREMAVRQSLGASRLRIVRTLLAEGLIVSAIAWIAACATAWVVARTIVSFLPPTGLGVTVAPDFSPDWTVVGYAMTLAIVATVAFTVAPALRAYRQAVLPWLKAGEHGVVQGNSRLSSGLVIVQLAFAVVLLTSAGLAYRSQTLIGARDLGFDTDPLLLLTVSTAGRATDPATNMALLDRVRARLLAVPGVLSMASVRTVPAYIQRDPIRRAGVEQPVLADGNSVGSDYLQTIGVPLIAGRTFTENEAANGHKVVLINQNLADALWPGRSVLGETLLVGRDRRPYEVVGVVPNAHFNGNRDEPQPKSYILSQRQQPPGPGYMHFYIRYTGTFDTIAPTLTRALRDTDAQVPIVYLRSMDTQLASVSWPMRVVSNLLTMFAIGSLAIAAIGQYAVMAFNMRRRTRDFGVRIALGASSRQILTSVIAEGCRLTAIGLTIGFALSLACSAAFRSLLAGVTPTDAPTYAGVVLLLGVASLLACYLPAHRASRINPIEALRQE
jgi:macrolide transport system ATP-binding/permease protein